MRHLLLGLLLLLPGTAATQQVRPLGVPPEQAPLLARVVAYTKFYGNLLNLHEWTITAKLDALLPDAAAVTRTYAGRREAFIAYDSVALREEQEVWRVVLHELLHVATSHAHTLGLQVGGLNPEARAVIQYTFEDLVQRMAVWLVWPKPPEEK